MPGWNLFSLGTVLALAGAAATAASTGHPATVVGVGIVPAAPSPVAQPLICHSDVETGSLIKRHKVCLTKKQWRYVNEVSHNQAQQLIDDQRTRSGCNGPSC